MEAAEKFATSQPGGRLATPLLGILDEAANVCRWKALPDQYSHYGSRGIILMTILQSWSQGVEDWTLEGMRKLWSASNVKIYAGGVSEVGYLDELSRLIGQYSYINVSRSHSKHGSSSSRQENKDEILSVADLTVLPRFRAILLASGAPAAMIETIPWMNGPHAQKVKDSLAATAGVAREPVAVSAAGAAFAWCPAWYQHPEALIRMESIWRAWEHLRMEPALGVSIWWLNHADPHMRVLMDKEGPFKKCAYDGHKSPTPERTMLPHVVPEVGIFG